MKIACIQQVARDVKNYKKAWDDILNLIDKAGEKDVDLMVLPECAYPAFYLGYDKSLADVSMEYFDEIIKDVSERSKKYNTYIAIGIVLKKENELINGGLLFDRKGKIIQNCGKCNLWHFDRKWFSCGSNFETVDTDFGKVGMMICADGRAPEIARMLALNGAELIIDMANLTSTGGIPSKLTNPQYEYMLPTRALENGTWIAMADKVGLEADSVLYAGSSCIINPDGEIVAAASSDKEEIIYAEIDMEEYKDKELPKREPDKYKILVRPIEKLPVYKDMTEPLVVWDTEMQTAVVQFLYTLEEDYVRKANEFIKSMEDQDCFLIMLPQLARGMDAASCMNKIKASINQPNTLISLTGYRKDGSSEFKTTSLFSKDKVFGQCDKSHSDEADVSSGNINIIETPFCRIGIMHDKEGLIPEVARCMMLEGADIVLWSDNSIDTKPDLVTRTRASENKIYLVRTGSMEEGDCCTITNPDGRIIASTISGIDQATSAMIVTALSKSKTVIPGTNVVLDRKPILYEVLVK